MFRHLSRVWEPVRKQLLVVCRGEAGGVGGVGGAAVGEPREDRLAAALRRTMPGITYLSIEDISGGCGAMFEVSVEAKEFCGLSRVKQHRLVTESLKTEIAEMHGIRIHTMVPTTDKK